MNSLQNDIQKYNRLYNYQQSSIDIYGLYDVLCSIFKDLGVLIEDNIKDKEKFAFIEGRPNTLYTGEEVLVGLELGLRQYGVYNNTNSSISNKPVVQNKPRSIGVVKNPITGNLEEFFSERFENEILLSVYSAHYTEMIRVVKYIESVLRKHRGLIEQRVSSSRLISTSPTHYYSNNASTQIQVKTIVLQIHTEEIFSKVFEEIQHINNQNINR